jgi:hypothetical protein
VSDQDFRQAASLIFDEALLVAIATFLALKALVFRRFTAFGRAISRSNLALAIAYYSTALGLHIGFFRTDAWRWGIRILVLVTTVQAVRQAVLLLGGWRATGIELRIAAAELAWEMYHLPSAVYQWCCSGLTLGSAAWRRATIWRRTFYVVLALLVVIAWILAITWILSDPRRETGGSQCCV